MTTDTPNKSVQIVVCALNNWRMHVNCKGLDEPLDTSKFEALQRIMNEFGRECHLTFIWVAGFIGSLETVRRQLEINVEPDGWIGVASERLDGYARSLPTRIRREEALQAFADGDRFEAFCTRSFVTLVSTHWNDVARLRIAETLRVEPDTVRSQVMHEWRLLRNWLTHRSRRGEDQYFNDAVILPGLVDSQRGNPEISAAAIPHLMDEINVLNINVDPLNLGLPDHATSRADRESATPGQTAQYPMQQPQL